MAASIGKPASAASPIATGVVRRSAATAHASEHANPSNGKGWSPGAPNLAWLAKAAAVLSKAHAAGTANRWRGEREVDRVCGMGGWSITGNGDASDDGVAPARTPSSRTMKRRESTRGGVVLQAAVGVSSARRPSNPAMSAYCPAAAVPPLHGLLAVLALAGAAAAQLDGLPTERVCLVPPGGFVDLDAGLVLPAARWQRVVADLQFGRDGVGLYLEPLAGGAVARVGQREPPPELTAERARFDMNTTAPVVAFVRTDQGMARVECFVADTYATGSAVLRWVVVPPKNPVFLPPPTGLVAEWRGDHLHVQWTGDQARWLVDVETGDTVRKETCAAPWIDLAGLDAKARHRVLVRGLGENHEVSLPGCVVQWGPRQPPVVGQVEFPDAWYGTTGGLRVTSGAVAREHAEVVFYLYGVFVPGGGVTRVGSGERAFAALSELPAGPFPPVYGRLDDDDVLVVCLADGRYAKLWLQPTTRDLRSGMRVHFAFLPDGRRTLLAPPVELQAERAAAGTRLTWKASPGAVRYRIQIGDRPALETVELAQVVADLPANRVMQASVVAVGADGEVSGAAIATVLTYGPEVRHGFAVLEVYGGGLDFAAGAVVARADVEGGRRVDLAIVNSAGGASSLAFGGDVAAGSKHGFGELPALAAVSFAQRIETDDRDPGSEHFYVRTAGGGLASVRIVGREFPRVKVEYVWRPQQ